MKASTIKNRLLSLFNKWGFRVYSCWGSTLSQTGAICSVETTRKGDCRLIITCDNGEYTYVFNETI